MFKMSEWCSNAFLMDMFCKSHNASVSYPTMQHFVTEMCTFVHISVTKWCIVGYLSDALWHLWDGSIVVMLSCTQCYIFICVIPSDNVIVENNIGRSCYIIITIIAQLWHRMRSWQRNDFCITGQLCRNTSGSPHKGPFMQSFYFTFDISVNNS